MSELSVGVDTLTIDGVSADTAGREASRGATAPKKVAINERFFMTLLPSKPESKTADRRSVVRAQHSGAGAHYRALSSLLRASGSLQPSVKSNDCWNRKASAVDPPAGTVPSI